MVTLPYRLNDMARMEEMPPRASAVPVSIQRTAITSSDGDSYFFGSGSLPEISNRSDHPIEQADWLEINHQLRQHGYDPIMLSHPNKMKNTTSGFVVLDDIASHHLRNNIGSLIRDTERRQELLQEIVTSSNRLQNELENEARKNDNLMNEMMSVKTLMETEKFKCQEMERQRSNELHDHAEEIQKLTSANSHFKTRCEEVEKTNSDLFLRLPKYGHGGSEFKKKEASHSNTKDTSRSDIEIKQEMMKGKNHKRGTTRDKKSPSYSENKSPSIRLKDLEKEITNIRREMLMKTKATDDQSESTSDEVATVRNKTKEHRRSDDARGKRWSNVSDKDITERKLSPESTIDIAESISSSSCSAGISDAGFLYKRLKLTEKKLKEAKKFIREISEENSQLITELKKRPKSKEWRKTLVYNKQMEKLLSENNLSPPMCKTSGSVEKSIRNCTHVNNIDFLPIDACRQHLKEICTSLNVTSIQEIPRKLEAMEYSMEMNYKMEKILRTLIHTVEIRTETDISGENGDTLNDSQWQILVPTIKVWQKELQKLKTLSYSIGELSAILIPWKTKESLKIPKNKGSEEKITVDKIHEQIKELGNDCQKGPIKHRQGNPSKEKLKEVVEHFMKLFDVENISGTFARMNDVYVKHAEMANVLHTIRVLLALERNASVATIVNAVGSLARAKHLLHVEDLDTVIKGLDQYDEFYAAFKSIISDLFDILGVDQIGEIVPAVRALVRFP